MSNRDFSMTVARELNYLTERDYTRGPNFFDEFNKPESKEKGNTSIKELQNNKFNDQYDEEVEQELSDNDHNDDEEYKVGDKTVGFMPGLLNKKMSYYKTNTEVGVKPTIP